jgi:hypothetical protein
MIEAGECLKIRQLNEADFGGGCKFILQNRELNGVNAVFFGLIN